MAFEEVILFLNNVKGGRNKVVYRTAQVTYIVRA